MIRTVVIYARESKATDGETLEHQVSRLERIAEAKRWEVVGRYVDDGRSGRTIAKRPAFTAMLAAAEAHAFDAVLITAPDRWARNLLDAEATEEHLDRLGIRVLDAESAWTAETVNHRSSGQRMMRRMAKVQAVYYSDMLAEKISGGIGEKARAGLHVGDVPFGYSRPDPRGPLVPGPEAPAVRELYERHATGLYSLAEEAAWLNACGEHPHSKRGRTAFTKSGVKEILRNPVYVGDLRLGEEVLPGSHEAIVSRDLFAAVQGVRQGHHLPRPASGEVYLLSGIGKHLCGAPLWANGAHRARLSWRPRYRCGAQQLGLAARCERVTAERDAVDAEVGEMFAHLELPADWRADIVAADAALVRDPDAEASTRRRLADRLVTVRRALLDGLVPYAEGAAEIRALEVEMASLAPRRPLQAVEMAGDALTTMREMWPQMTSEERRECVRTALVAVHVDLEEPRITGIVPTADFEPLFAAMECLELVRPGGPGHPLPNRLYVPRWTRRAA